MSTVRGRVLLLGTFLSEARATRAVGEDLAERLAERDWQVLTASSYVRPLPRLLDSLSQIVRRRLDYDVAQIDLYSGRAFHIAETCASLLRRLGKPYVVTLHGGGLPELARESPERVGRLLRSAHAVTSPSPWLREALGFLRPDILVVPNPLDLERYTYRERRPLRPHLLWLRAFAEIYRPADAVRTLRVLRQRGLDARLHLVGPDKDGRALEEVHRVLEGLEKLTTLEPEGRPKSDVPAVYDGSDIFLNTTSVDNTPVTVLEAMACGLPVVTTDAGGLRALVDHDRDGLLVPVGEPVLMAEAVERLIAEPETALRLARAARRKVESWDWSHVVETWEDLFDSIGLRRAA